MDIIIYIFAIFGLSFFITNSDGPWGIMNWLRNKLMRNKYCGVFFYKLLSCSFCTGCYVGWITYLLSNSAEGWTIQKFILWTFAGGGINFILNTIVDKLNEKI